MWRGEFSSFYSHLLADFLLPPPLKVRPKKSDFFFVYTFDFLGRYSYILL